MQGNQQKVLAPARAELAVVAVSERRLAEGQGQLVLLLLKSAISSLA